MENGTAIKTKQKNVAVTHQILHALHKNNILIYNFQLLIIRTRYLFLIWTLCYRREKKYPLPLITYWLLIIKIKKKIQIKHHAINLFIYVSCYHLIYLCTSIKNSALNKTNSGKRHHKNSPWKDIIIHISCSKRNNGKLEWK